MSNELIIGGSLELAGLTGSTLGSLVTVSGDLWLLSNARWDDVAGEFYRIDRTKAAFGFQQQGQTYIPGEADLGYYVAGATIWVAQPESYDLIRGGGLATGARFGAIGGWELGSTVTQQRNLTVGGMGIEVDGNGTFPYGRVVHNTTGTIYSRRNTGIARNLFADFGGKDDNNQNSWFMGYTEQYDGSGATVAGSQKFSMAKVAPNSTVWTDLFTVSSTGALVAAGGATFNGPTVVNGDETLNGNLGVTGSASVGSLGVTAAASIGGTLTVVGGVAAGTSGFSTPGGLTVGGATRIAGPLLLSGQAAFIGYGPAAVTGAQVVIFTATLLNRTSCYNTVTGAFTAPQPGVYHFKWNHLAPYAETGEIRVGLAVNGAIYPGTMYIYTKSTPNTFFSMGMGSYISLSAGDTVTLQCTINIGTWYNDGTFSSFSGSFCG